MNRHWNSYENKRLSRRDLLKVSSAGFGHLALAGLLAQEQAIGASVEPLAVKAPHFPARAKRVIFLFMHGGPSQVDTFDYKPLLKRDHGKPLPFARPKVVSSETFNLLQSPWGFKQYGQSGAWVSDLFPEIANVLTTFASSSRCTAPIRAMVAHCWNCIRARIHSCGPVWVPGSLTVWVVRTPRCRAS